MHYLRLKELRRQKNVTQRELAKYLKITREAYSQYETGKRQMSFESLCLLADYFGVTTDYVLGRDTADYRVLNSRERVLLESFRDLDEKAKTSLEVLIHLHDHAAT